MKSKIKKFVMIVSLLFLFIVILSMLNGFKTKDNKKLKILHAVSFEDRRIAKFNFNVKSKNIKPEVEPAASSKKPLNDIFSIPYKKYEKYDNLFIYFPKHHRSGTAYYNAKPALDFINRNHSLNSGENFNNIVNNLKFKGFSGKERRKLTLMFIGGTTALIKINGKKHYVHKGEKIGDVFILKVDPSKIVYARKGKILFKYINI